MNQKSKPSHYLMDKIHDSLEDLQVIQARIRGRKLVGYRKGKGRTHLDDSSLGWKEWKLKSVCKVTFIWTPGHEGVEGNKKADEAAKLVAQGESSPHSTLPTLIRKKILPISISATHQILKKNMKLRWKHKWTTSPRFEHTHKIDLLLPSDYYLDIIDQLCCNQASLLTQLRTGQVPLNAILHRMKHSNTPDCPHCGQGHRELIIHFLLTCPLYSSARRLLQFELGREAHSIPFLLGCRTAIPHLLHYISNTRRLRAIFRETHPDEDFELQPRYKPKDIPPPNPITQN